MTRDALRRPLVVGLVLYMGLLAALWRAGLFRVRPPAPLAAWCSAPDTDVAGVILSGVTPKRPGDRYWFRADAAHGRTVPPAKLLVYLKKGDPAAPDLRPGARVVFTGRLRRPLRPRRPGGYDEGGFLDVNGAALVLHAGRVEPVAPPPPRWWPWAAGESLHLSVHRWLASRFDPVRASILEGLALGYRGALPKEVDDGLERAGVVQLLTPSGDKVTAVLGAGWALGLALGLFPAARGLLALAAGAAFLCVVLPEPSHTRPLYMAAAAFAARLSGREPGRLQVWVLAAWTALLWDPRQLFGAGFLLTYGALLAIILVVPRWGPDPGWPLLWRLLWAGAAFELAMQAALTPALAAFFGQVSPAACLVNPVAMPSSAFASAAVWAGWAASLTGRPAFEAGPAWAAGRVADAFLWTAREVGTRPWAAVPVARPGAAGLLVYALGAGALFLLPDRRAARRLAGSAVVAAALLGAKEVYSPKPIPSEKPHESAQDPR